MSDNPVPVAPEEFVHVFVSYAREDRRWLDPDYRFSLIPFLVESLRRHKVAFWFDKELKPGDEFKRHIESQIDQSQIALLIVSQSFLNSEFIENREMPRIAERARQGKMIIVPVLVEPCDWSEYPFLADRQMVPSSPLIDYTESEPQWAKVRFQILDGLKAQLKRIREAPQSHAQKTQTSAPEESLSASATSAVADALEMPAATLEIGTAPEDHADRLREEQEAETPSAPTVAASEVPTMTSTTVEQKKARIPRKWMIAIAGGAVLVVAVVLLLIFMGRGGPWKARNSGTTNDLLSVFGTSDGQRLWAVGMNGTIVGSDDGGATWTPRNRYTASWLSSITGTSDGGRLWAVGDKGTILESDDLGATWFVRESGTTEGLYSIFGTSNGKQLWAAGDHDTILRSRDGGATWKVTYSVDTPLSRLNSIFGTSDGKRLWAVSEERTIMESDDGGTTWAAPKNEPIADPHATLGASDGRRLWAVGWNGTIAESDDAGASWTVRNSCANLLLYSVFATSDGKHLWADGQDGTILESDDGGASWFMSKSRTRWELYVRSRFGINDWLYSISGTSDGSHLWAVGAGGTILESDR